MSQIISGLLYSKSLPTAGEAATCLVESNGVVINPLHQRVHFDALKAMIGGFDHNQLQLHWQSQNEDFTFIPADKAAQKALYSQLPASEVVGLKGWKTATSAQSAVWNSLWYLTGLIALTFALVIWQYDRVLDWVTTKISIETEKKMGESVLTSLSGQSNILREGVAVDAVKAIGGALTKGSKYQYQWFVSNDDTVNAFAMPGGIVVVNSGLLKKADSANELAAVLAHEVQHVEQRHALKNMLNSAGIATVVMVVLGDANAAMVIIAHKFSSQFFSRNIEAEADLKGAALLIKQKIKPEGMVTFFKKLAEEHSTKNPNASAMPEWLSSHPDTAKRIEATRVYITKHVCVDCKQLVWDKAQILKSLTHLNDKK